MIPDRNVFHQAIPTHDLDLAEQFYTSVLGAIKARRYDDRVTFNFFEHQLVCHLCPEAVNNEVSFYPRHFGMTFLSQSTFRDLIQKIQVAEHEFYLPLSERFSELPERHQTFALLDPSNNVIEFKCYEDPRYIY